MDWVLEFYSRQEELCGCYSGAVADHHRDKICAIERLAGPGRKRVLELGAGGGQHACAAAEAGHTVLAVELVETAAAHARELATTCDATAVEVRTGDFYTIEIDDAFDVVCYWDGFGVGTDEDQRRLLRRMAGWLAPGGCAIVDIYNPFFAAQTIGREMTFDRARRRYDFDFEGMRWLDTWWHDDEPDQAVTQSLRCYAPADLRLLLEGTGLTVSRIELPDAELDRVVSYPARLELESASSGSGLK